MRARHHRMEGQGGYYIPTSVQVIELYMLHGLSY